MKLKEIITLTLIFSLILVCNYVLADNNVQGKTNQTATANGSATTTTTTQGTTSSYVPSEEFLNKEIVFDEIVTVKQGTTVKEFIEQEKERRLKNWYSDKISEGYTVEFGNAVLYAIKGTTNRDELYNKNKLNDNELIRTNVEVEIATTVSKDGEIAPTVGEGTAVGVVVTGDITGTGEIDVTDLSTIQEEIVETIELKGTYKKAADMDKNGEIDVVDLSQLQEYIVNN